MQLFHHAAEKSMCPISPKQPNKNKSYIKYYTNCRTQPQQKQNRTPVQQRPDKPKIGYKKMGFFGPVKKKYNNNTKYIMNKTSYSCGNTSSKVPHRWRRKSISRDFLMLDEKIYQCPNIDKVNQKLIFRSSKLYSHERFITITVKNMQKLEKYLLGFLTWKYFHHKHQIHIKSMSKQQKIKLYTLLRLQTDNPTKDKKNYTIQNLIKSTYKRIQKKAEQTIKARPNQQPQIKIWKNTKLHQLMFCCQYLQLVDKSTSSFLKDEHFELDLNHKLQLQLLEKQQHQKSTSVGNAEQQPCEQKIFINTHLVQEKYPTKINTPKYQITKYLPNDHYLSDTGIQNFLYDLWNYMVDENHIPQLVNKLKQPYGISELEKKQLIDDIDDDQWQEYFVLKSKNVLPDQLFISFSRYSHSTQPESTAQQQKFKLIFLKAVFDLLNTFLSQFQTNYPFGPYNPLEHNLKNSEYIINFDNIIQVWDECLQNICQINQIGLGTLTPIQNQCMEEIVLAHNSKVFIQENQSDSDPDFWDQLSCLQHRHVITLLVDCIEDILWIQFTHQYPINF